MSNVIIFLGLYFVVAVHSLSHAQLFATPFTATRHPSLSFTVSWSLLRPMSIESVMSSNHLVLCHSPFLQSFPASESANEPALHIGWPKYWSFGTSPFNDDSGLISFRMDWLDLLAVQGTLRSLLQHHSLEASFLQCSAFFGFPRWHVVKNLPANARDIRDSGSIPGSEDPLEKGTATHSGLLA